MKNKKFTFYIILQKYDKENNEWVDLGEADSKNSKQMNELMRLLAEYKRNNSSKVEYRLVQKTAFDN